MDAARMRKVIVTTMALALCLGMAGVGRAAVTTFTEDFETGFTGTPIGNHADWGPAGAGMTPTAGSGLVGSVGLPSHGNIVTWTAHTFDWSGAQFNSFTAGMDFKTDGTGRFDDDRIGWMINMPTTGSSNIMSVQMDPGGSGYNIEGYWDGVGGTDKRPSIVDIPALGADTWYRLTATFTKTAISNEPIIDVDLQELDGAGNPTGSVASATLDTADLPAADRPNSKYFSGTVFPSYKNYNHGFADNAFAEIDDDTLPPAPPPPVIAQSYFDEPPEGTRDWTPGGTDEDLGFSTGNIVETRGAGTISHLGTYDSGSSPWRYRMRTVEAEITMDTVDLTDITDGEVSIDVMIKDTSWESTDYFVVTVTNGVDTIDVAREEGTLAGLSKLTWMNYSAAIPDAWTEATMTFSSYTNSSANSEAVDFDNIEFRGEGGAPDPDPDPDPDPEPEPTPGGAHFTATADPRSNHAGFLNTLQAVNTHVGGPGLFHVSVGDIDGTVQDNRDQVDTAFGANAVWIPGIGNHEEETGADMEWLRAEYDNGHGTRTPLNVFTNADGPVGTQRTTYSWDDEDTNTHYIMLNEYWNGGTNEGTGTSLSGDDTAANGDIVPALRAWLEADLIANQDKAIFVFGHEPAFPQYRHVGDSLDGHPANRDAFWALLEQYGVEALFVGHTHTYYKHQGDKDGIGSVWQIDLGNAGNGSIYTFVDIVLLDGQVRYDVYNNSGGWHLVESWLEDANSRSGAEVVPEPAGLALVGVALLALRRRRSQQCS